MINYSKVLAANTDFLTAQSFVFLKDSINQKNTQLCLAVVISATGEDVFLKVKQAVNKFSDRFFESDLAVSEKFDQAYKFLQQELQGVQSLQIALSLWQENVLYLQSWGEHKGYLLRDNSLTDLTSDVEGSQLISGFLKDNDKLLLITTPGIDIEDENLAKDKWEEKTIYRFLNLPLDALEEDVLSFLHQSGKNMPIAAVLMENDPLIQPITVNSSIASGPEVEIADQVNATPEESEVFIPPIQKISLQSYNDDRIIPKKKLLIPKLPVNPLKFKNIFIKRKSLKDSSLYSPEKFDSSRPNIKLKILRPRGHKFIGFSVVMLTVFFAVGFLTYKNWQSNQEKQVQTAALINSAKNQYNEAVLLKDQDAFRSQEKLKEAQKTVEVLLKKDPENSEGKNLQQQIEQNSADILKAYEITDWPIFLSLNLIKDNFNAQRLSFSVGKFLLLDTNAKSLVAVDIAKKTPEILAGEPQMGDVQYASLNGSNAFVYSPDKGVLKIELGTTSKPVVVSSPDKDWGEVADIFGFGGGIYLMDSGKNQIYKYLPITSGYSEKINYLKDGQVADFIGAKRLFIDYSVWTLEPGPEITKYTGGEEDNFSVGGLEESLVNVVSIFVPEEQDAVYLLDADNSRIVVLKKTGQYLAQYKGEKFKTATDFVIDEENKKIYLLENNVIYQLDLRS